MTNKSLLPIKTILLTSLFSIFIFCPAQAEDPLPSWNPGKTKSAILAFVKETTTEGIKSYIPESERIAVFDNDGNLWSEQPLYFQLQFAIDRVKALAPKHPEWKTKQPFKAVIENDKETLLASGKKGLLELVMTTHAGMTTKEFEKIVADWLKSAQHPRFKRPYTDLIYQPMLELLEFLRQNNFKTFIVSGGGVEFMRVWSEQAYGIPPEQTIGSSIKTKFELKDGKPAIVRLPEIDFIDDKDGKPIGINKHIGRHPVFASGNSDGDLQMIQWTTLGRPNSFGLIVHHDDKDREWAYDRDSHIGRLDKALDEAKTHGWTVISMKRDWKQIYPFEKKN